MFRNLLITLLLFGSLILEIGCSSSENNPVCDITPAELSENNLCVSIEHNGLTNAHRNIIEAKVLSGLVAINNLMPIDNLNIRIVENPQLVIPEIGIGGFNPGPQEIILAIDANFMDLDSSLEDNLIAQLAHETHHAKRRRSVGYGSTLLQAAVSEGLADHFSIEVTGINPPLWAVSLKGVELQNWISTASNTWNEASYDHAAWFLGRDQNIPRWTGYSIGFELVKNYLTENPDKKASKLHDEPANSFLTF